MVVRLPVVLI